SNSPNARTGRSRWPRKAARRKAVYFQYSLLTEPSNRATRSLPRRIARESQIRRALNAASQELIQHRLDGRCREGAAVFVQETLRCQLGRDRDMRPGERGILSPYP